MKRARRIALARKGGVCERLRVWFSARSSRRRGRVGRAIVIDRHVALIGVMEQMLVPAPGGAPVIWAATSWFVDALMRRSKGKGNFSRT